MLPNGYDLPSFYPEVSKLNLVVMALKFDWQSFRTLFLASTGVTRQGEIIMDQFLILIDGDPGIFNLLAIVKSGCTEGSG